MFIIIKILLFFIFCYLSGLGVTSFFSQSLNTENRKKLSFIIPGIGFALSQVMFWILYYIFEQVELSFIGTVIPLLFLSFYSIKKFKKEKKVVDFVKDFLPERSEYKIIYVLLFILVLSTWQYLIIGEGKYYLSGNPDTFDSFTGADGYLSSTPLSAMDSDFSYNFRLQYSSVALVRLLLGGINPDAFLIQAISNLLLAAIGIYWLSRFVFKFKISQSLWISFWCVAGNFYFTTFIAGHVGSLMYLSLIAPFLGLLLLWSRNEINYYFLIICLLFYCFLQWSYPRPVYFILFPALVIIIYQKFLVPKGYITKITSLFFITKKNESGLETKSFNYSKIIIAILIIFIGIILFNMWLWNYFEPERISSSLRTFIAWKISLYKEMVPIFWGIYPSQTVTSSIFLSFIAGNTYLNNTSFIVGIILILFSIYASFLSIKSKNSNYLFIFSVFFIFYFIFMRYFWASSYYFYKFLYLNYFVVIILLSIFIFEGLRSWNKLIKKIIIFSIILVGLINLTWNILTYIPYLNLPFNNSQQITDIIKELKKRNISKISLDVPSFLYNKVLSYIFHDAGIKLKTLEDTTRYKLKMNNLYPPISNELQKENILYKNNYFKIVEELSANRISSYSLYEPEVFGSSTLNWIGYDINLKTGLGWQILNLAEYIKSELTDEKFYIDILYPDTYYSIYYLLNKGGIKLEKDPSKANYFIRIRQKSNVYDKVPNEKTIWLDRTLAIDFVPNNDRKYLPFQGGKFSSQIIEAIKSKSNNIFLDIPKSEYIYLYLKYILDKNGIKIVNSSKESELIAKMELLPPYEKYNYSTINSTSKNEIWRSSNDMFENKYYNLIIYEIPIEGRTISENVRENDLPFNVITSPSQKDYQIRISNYDENSKYLRFYIAPGPCIDFRSFGLSIISGNNSFKETFNISYPATFINVDLSKYKSDELKYLDIYLEAKDLNGKSLLPFEERFLNYAVYGIELTNNLSDYSEYFLNVFNNKSESSIPLLDRYIFKTNYNDIIDKNNNVFLGSGWSQLEISDSRSFRWCGDTPVELILKNIKRNTEYITISLEKGPSCGEHPLKLSAVFENDTIQQYYEYNNETIRIKIPEKVYSDTIQQYKIKLIPESNNLIIPQDPRILNYRVFNISLEQYHPQLKFADGWHPVELFNGEFFRWAKDIFSEIQLTGINNRSEISISVEPGPGCGKKPLRLRAFLDNELLNEYSINGRQTISINFPENIRLNPFENHTLKFEAISDNIKVQNDPRILNFRIFNFSFDKNIAWWNPNNIF